MTINQLKYQETRISDPSRTSIKMSRFLHHRPVTKLNWRIIAGINIVELENDGITDSKILQDILPGIAFCNLDDEFNEKNWILNTDESREVVQQDVQSLPPGFAKLFRLTQLIIQYLLHSQKKLTDAIKALQSNNSGLQKTLKSLSKKIHTRDQEINALKLECVQRKKLLEKQQDFINKGKDPGNFSKCSFCPKVFVNESYMMSHQFRRHPEDMNNPRIQKISRHGNEKNYSKSPMSSNDNYIKSETTVTSNDVSNGKIYEPSNDRLTMEKNYNNAETDPKLLEILLDLKSDVGKVIKRGEDCDNGNGNFTLSTDDIVANNSETLQSKSSSIPVTVVEEIRLIVKRQELEIEEMRKRLENVDIEKEDNRSKEGAKLEAQECYWQAQIKSKEQAHAVEMEKVMKELSRLDNTMKTFKEVTLNKHQEVLSDLDDDDERDEPQFINNEKSSLDDPEEQKMSYRSDNLDTMDKMHLNDGHHQISSNGCTTTPYKENYGIKEYHQPIIEMKSNLDIRGNENDACTFNKETVDTNRIGKRKDLGDDEEYDDVAHNKVTQNLSNRNLSQSMRDLHEYASIQSLWDTFDRCQGDDEALDNNNAFLAPYRNQVLNDIQQRLRELDALSPQDKNFDQHRKDDGIPDQCLQKAMKSLKAIRKNQSNAKSLQIIRRQCRDEVDGLLSQAGLDMIDSNRKDSEHEDVHPSNKRRSISKANKQNGNDIIQSQANDITSSSFGQRMSSVRKRLLKSWRKRRRQQIQMKHETTRFIDDDELANKYPHLERKKPEEDNLRISGKKEVSEKDRREITDTVEALFPHSAPTPPPRHKISRLRKNKEKSFSSSNSSSQTTPNRHQIPTQNDNDNAEIRDDFKGNNISSNIYVESPVRQKSNLSPKRDAPEKGNHETDSENVQKLQKEYPIPAPRASIEKSNATQNFMIAEKIRHASSEHEKDSKLHAYMNPYDNNHDSNGMLDANDDEELKCESANDVDEENVSVEELIDQEFDVSVDVHYKQEDETKTEEQSESIEEDSDEDEEDSMTDRSIVENSKPKIATRLVYSSESSEDNDGFDQESSRYERDCFSPVSASDIRLKKPIPGSKIDNLRSKIEQQMEEDRRKREEREKENKDGENEDDIDVDKSNTETVSKMFQQDDEELSGIVGTSSWDSDHE